jgi:hypothetical protein
MVHAMESESALVKQALAPDDLRRQRRLAHAVSTGESPVVIHIISNSFHRAKEGSAGTRCRTGSRGKTDGRGTTALRARTRDEKDSTKRES